ncbi:MAG: MotA/TolQ/ExbB proton channel family protein [Proteobacteria bacterium]|nr:MotA/TolQ/ExbB proton channel family protein [Pseudomonadota bacterium]MCP4920854.1 MotA/TolQ/ExbB proton channel family protein [Pseudomonadota bacterium]
MSFDLQHIWEASTPQTLTILAMLFIMGILSIYVAIERFVTLKKATDQSRDLAEALSKPMADGDVAAGHKLCGEARYKASYLGHLMGAALKELDVRFDRHGVDAAERAIERQNIQEQLDLRKGMNILATVGSTAPFVGLVGTIFGIINAFSAMAEAGGGGLGSVSAGIAEALVATAIGIFVAIVGVWFFNYFTARLERIDNDIQISVAEFRDWAEKQLLTDGDEPPTEQVLATK